ncbi:hypothetical protein COCVIDRAFT_38603 [Bipolaris victoriae FI3]|uniref:Rhodopsin domain-containing protein n=1 Tax=Bipolaris victoriae (strain FI3) TaxID=930091 RepID=W7EDA0_BIPV3|nr:hypothetical protein COCVIDRAFT_38603 [Bipolaris victoriae FI3]
MGKPADFADILNGVMWFQVFLATVFIALRLYTRQWIVRNFGWDDVLMLVNLATFIGYVACISIGVNYGVGKKTADIIRLDLDYSKAIMWEAIGQGICIMGIAASKGSVALFLLRIVVKQWHVGILWFCIISTTILCVITTALLYAQCIPTAFLWDRTIEGGHCWLNFTPVGLTMGAWSASMDFVLAILPWHVLMGLNMKHKEKITIASGLSLGIFAGACSVVRTIELQSLASMENYVYDTASMLLWSSSEVCMTIVCACIPVLRPLYVRVKYGSRGDSSNKDSYHLKEYSKSKSSRGDGSQPGNKIYMGPGESVLQTTVHMGSDAASEETILRDCNQSRHHASAWDQLSRTKEPKDIHVTTTVTSRDYFV